MIHVLETMIFRIDPRVNKIDHLIILKTNDWIENFSYILSMMEKKMRLFINMLRIWKIRRFSNYEYMSKNHIFEKY